MKWYISKQIVMKNIMQVNKLAKKMKAFLKTYNENKILDKLKLHTGSINR
jgi:hypothetical protein